MIKINNKKELNSEFNQILNNINLFNYYYYIAVKNHDSYNYISNFDITSLCDTKKIYFTIILKNSILKHYFISFDDIQKINIDNNYIYKIIIDKDKSPIVNDSSFERYYYGIIVKTNNGTCILKNNTNSNIYNLK